MIDRAERDQWSYRDFLTLLATEEIAHRQQTRLARLTRRAHCPFLKTIDDFNFTYQSSLRLQMLGFALAPDFVCRLRVCVDHALDSARSSQTRRSNSFAWDSRLRRRLLSIARPPSSARNRSPADEQRRAIEERLPARKLARCLGLCHGPHADCGAGARCDQRRRFRLQGSCSGPATDVTRYSDRLRYQVVEDGSRRTVRHEGRSRYSATNGSRQA